MTRISVTDEWLYKYVPLLDEAIISELERETDYEYQFSDRFGRRMQRLIRREESPWRNMLYSLTRKAAVLFVCAAASLFAITMSTQAYRVRFFETVKSIWEDAIIFSYVAEDKQEDFQCHEPRFIPEGYQETERSLFDNWLDIIYTDENGCIITWDQVLVQDGEDLIVDAEYDWQITREVQGMNIVLSMYDDGFIHAYCEHGAYVYQLTSDKLSVDEVCLMFGSIF